MIIIIMIIIKIMIILIMKIINNKTVYIKCKIDMKDMLLNKPSLNYQTIKYWNKEKNEKKTNKKDR